VLEQIIKQREIGEPVTVDAVLSGGELTQISALSRRIFLPDVVTNYIARLVDATHAGVSSAAQGVKFGASPRAALALAAAARARALLEGRMNASFEDVRAVAAPVLQHRLVLDYSARIEGRKPADVVAALLEQTPAQDYTLPKSLLAAKI